MKDMDYNAAQGLHFGGVSIITYDKSYIDNPCKLWYKKSMVKTPHWVGRRKPQFSLFV